MEIVIKFAPIKTRSIASDDQAWFTDQLKTLDRRKKREFQKNRRSEKFHNLNKEFKSKCSKEKK